MRENLNLHLIQEIGYSVGELAVLLRLPVENIRSGMELSKRIVERNFTSLEPFYVDWKVLWWQA